MTFGAGGQRSNPLSYGRRLLGCSCGSRVARESHSSIRSETPGFILSPATEPAASACDFRRGVPRPSIGTPKLLAPRREQPLAERAGFEPAEEREPLDGLANRCL